MAHTTGQVDVFYMCYSCDLHMTHHGCSVILGYYMATLHTKLSRSDLFCKKNVLALFIYIYIYIYIYITLLYFTTRYHKSKSQFSFRTRSVNFTSRIF